MTHGSKNQNAFMQSLETSLPDYQENTSGIIAPGLHPWDTSDGQYSGVVFTVINIYINIYISAPSSSHGRSHKYKCNKSRNFYAGVSVKLPNFLCWSSNLKFIVISETP